MVIDVTVVGPFKEEEEGTGIVSDVVKVMGEDPATPGLLPKGIDPGTVKIPQYRVNKTKQHTHTHTHLAQMQQGEAEKESPGMLPGDSVRPRRETTGSGYASDLTSPRKPRP